MSPLLAVCFLLQAQSAEETFKKIEETLNAAKSVRVQFVWDGATKSDMEGKVDARGFLFGGIALHCAAKE